MICEWFVPKFRSELPGTSPLRRVFLCLFVLFYFLVLLFFSFPQVFFVHGVLSTWCSFCCLQLLRSIDESLQFLKSTSVSPAVPITILLTHWPYLFAFCLCAFTAASSGWLIGAHVSAYTDGTVHVSTGAVEIGQGLNTKVALVVAMTLGLPVAHVWAEGGDTRMCSNSACTGGSGTSESCCNAAMQAALELKSRVQDKLDRGMSWVSAIQEAKNEGQSLQAESWFDGCVLLQMVWIPQKNRC